MGDERERLFAEAHRLRNVAIRAFWLRLGHRAIRLLECPGVWIKRKRNRTEMGRLDDRMLGDLGLSRDDVEHELRKPFWRD